MLPRRGFTLIELMTVIAVIAILASIVLAAAWGLFANQRVDATQVLLNSVQNAIADSDRVVAQHQAADGTISTVFLFDFNGDGLLDGRPEDDFDAADAAKAASMYPPYRGFLAETRFNAQCQLDPVTGRVLDGWSTPLRVRYKPSADVSGVIVQSAGEDGEYGTPDDIYSGEGGTK
jgi:prepilin-type N-terminal cleavage/methylation domain-containing protein